jgi:hypothetical protein
MAKHRKILKMSYEYLTDLILERYPTLSRDARVIQIFEDNNTETLSIKLESPDFEFVQEAEIIPEFIPRQYLINDYYKGLQ